MMLLADIECYDSNNEPKHSKQQPSYKLKKGKKHQSKDLFLSKLAVKTAGIGKCSQGKIAVMQSLIKNDVEFPIEKDIKQKVKQTNVRVSKNHNIRRRG